MSRHCLPLTNCGGRGRILQRPVRLALTDRSFDQLQYPRWLQKQHQQSGAFAKAVPVTATFRLDAGEAAALTADLGGGILSSGAFTIGKKYDRSNTLEVSLDEEAACRALEGRHGTTVGATTMPALKAELEKLAAETIPDPAATSMPTDRARAATAAKAEADALYPDGNVRSAVRRRLNAAAPKFFHFDEYSAIEGRTEIQPLLDALRDGTEAALAPAKRTALALLKLGYANEQLIDADYEKRSGEMEAVAADLTAQVRRYWHQNDHLRLQIDIESVEVRNSSGQSMVNRFLQLRVADERHHFSNNLDVRSSGFRWFVSFIAAFKDFEAGDRVVVLLDEPALARHAGAQADFLAFIEDTLATRHQVLYTTHSPFMVDAAHLERVRVVEDNGPEEGATVKTQLMSRDPDTLSPLQGALGYDVAQNIFVGPDNLVLEGLANYTYFTVVSEAPAAPTLRQPLRRTRS